jgi:hypothetical protein
VSLNVVHEKYLDSSWHAVIFNWIGMKVGLGIWAAWIWYLQLMPTTTDYFYQTVTPVLTGWQGAVFGMWQRWDGIYYQMIAEFHYTAGFPTAFFPVYPLLGRVIAQYTGLSALAALQFLSAAATLCSMVLLHRIAMDLFSREIANRVVMVVTLFPTAFFFLGLYPQSLALTWVLLAYHKARQNRWLAAGLAGLLAGMTHGTAVALAFMLAVQAWQAFRAGPQRLGKMRIVQGAALCGVIGLPLLGTMLFLAWRFAMGYPMMDLMQASDWGRVISMPWETLLALVNYFPSHWSQNWLILLNSFFLIVTIWVLIAGWRRLPLALNVYQVIMILYILSTRGISDPLLSLNRYILLDFPIYLMIGSFSFHRWVRLALFGIGVFGSLAISAMFFMWKWVG